MPLQILNSAQVTLLALQESDQEAFKRLLGFLLRAGVEPGAFKYSNIQGDAVDLDVTTADISVDRRKANIDLWTHQDSVSIKYRRTSLEAIKQRFGNVIRADLPTTKQELLSIFLAANGLYDRGSQAIDGSVLELGPLSLEIGEGEFLIYGSSEFELKPFQRQLDDVLEFKTLPGFRTVTDFEDSANDTLFGQLDVLNASAVRYPLEPELLEYATPIKLSGYRYDNTSIEVTAFGDGYYLGTTTIVYSRYDFGWANIGSQYLVDGPSTPSTQLMISSISAQTGLPISLSDVVIESYAPVPPGEVQTLTIFFKEECLRYTGELTIDYRAS
ncbi:hypothetical protein D9M68_17890 [compost metagenome]